MNVIIAHPSLTLAEGLILVLRRHGKFDTVRAVNDLEALMDCVVKAQPPTVAALHADLPGLNYETHIPQLRTSAPGCAVAVFATAKDPNDARRAIQAGARAYLSLDVAPEELSRQLVMAASGDVVISALASNGARDVMSAPVASVPSGNGRSDNDLTERELEVLRLVASGRTNLEIADALTLTGNTVKAHVRNILRKLQLRNRQQATAFAVQKGLLARVDLAMDDPMPERGNVFIRALPLRARTGGDS